MRSTGSPTTIDTLTSSSYYDRPCVCHGYAPRLVMSPSVVGTDSVAVTTATATSNTVID